MPCGSGIENSVSFLRTYIKALYNLRFSESCVLFRSSPFVFISFVYYLEFRCVVVVVVVVLPVDEVDEVRFEPEMELRFSRSLLK